MIFLGYLVNYFCLFNENMQISENRLSSCPFIFVSTRVSIPFWKVPKMPDRDNYIFIVPFGPRLLLKTSCKPFAALMFIAKACAALATSAFGFNDFTADIFSGARSHYKRKYGKHMDVLNQKFSNSHSDSKFHLESLGT